MLTEPNPTAYDLHFKVLGIPVRVHPLFWLISFLMGFHPDDPKQAFLWMAVVFLSILLHEMGHALLIRYFGWSPSVVLYSFGGLAVYNSPYSPTFQPYTGQRPRQTPWSQILISFAGPLAGFIVAGLVLAVLLLTGTSSIIVLGDAVIRLPGEPLPNFYMNLFVYYLLYVNIFWGLVNLLPIYPLDGGQISRELFLMADGESGLRHSLMLSLVCAIGIAVLGFMWEYRFIPILFALLAFSNFQQLSGPNRYGGSPW